MSAWRSRTWPDYAILVTRYDEILADARAWCERTREFLAGLGFATAAGGRRTVEAFFVPALHHHRAGNPDLFSGTLGAVKEAVTDLQGAHPEFLPPALPDEDPRVQALFDRDRPLAQHPTPPRAAAAASAPR